jgi:hypothetical protein
MLRGKEKEWGNYKNGGSYEEKQIEVVRLEMR